MRLLNTETYTLHTFMKTVPPYAILSHRWEEDEVSFKLLQDYETSVEDAQDAGDENEDPDALAMLAALRHRRYKKLTSMKGWSKVTGFCDKARAFGLEYAWIDTCCIDQSSSAELQEAINSMFLWYKGAEVCLVYLSDVERHHDFDPYAINPADDHTMNQFCSSQWFTRGWTLQELLASISSISFHDCDWSYLGNVKILLKYVSMASEINSRTLGLLLHDPSELGWICVAERMSWASKRQTTRPEDAAYCLLGIFDVRMSLIYGEGGHRSFVRLQLEIMTKTADECLLAWNPPGNPDDSSHFMLSALASSPRCFQTSKHAVKMHAFPCVKMRAFPWAYRANPQKIMIPHGLKLELTIVPIKAIKILEQKALPHISAEERQRVFAAPLLCRNLPPASITALPPMAFIFLKHLGLNLYRRFGPWVDIPCRLTSLNGNYSSEEVIILTHEKEMTISGA